MNRELGPHRRMDVAIGAAPPDLVVKGGRLLNVFTRELVAVDIAVAGERVAGLFPAGSSLGPDVAIVDATDQIVCPGLIDAHFHVGGSHMDIAHLAAALLARGTTAIATDFYEIYVAGGPEAVRYALDEARRAGLTVLFVPPVHLIGLEHVGTFAWQVSIDDMREMLGWPEAVGINEPPAANVLARPPGLVEVLEETIALRKTVVGHAPGETGAVLQAYVSVGASSDHESRSVPEALAKLRVGMRPMMRHGSASPDLAQLIDLARDFPMSTRYMMFCSDETDPGDLVAEGHMDTKIRVAVAAGIDPMTALEMATINVAEYFGVSARIGSVAPGRSADMVVVRDLGDFRPTAVIAGGRVVAGDGSSHLPEGAPGPAAGRSAPASIISRVNLAGPIEPAMFHLPARADDGATVTARVIGVRDGTLVSDALERQLRVESGVVLADPSRDILRIAVVERHHASGRVGRGFVEGFGLRDGAVAMTYCHAFNNMLVVGSSDEAMAVAARAVADDGGGITVVSGGQIVGRWPLRFVGILDDRPLEDVAASFAMINDAMRGIGCTLASPVLSFSFVALTTIPAYGLSDRGLYDVESQRFVDVLLPTAP